MFTRSERLPPEGFDKPVDTKGTAGLKAPRCRKSSVCSAERNDPFQTRSACTAARTSPTVFEDCLGSEVADALDVSVRENV